MQNFFLTPAEISQTLSDIGKKKAAAKIFELIIYGVLAGIYIASRTLIGKIFAIYFPIMTFVASGYEHSAANMFFLPIGLLVKGQFIPGFLGMFHNLIPVTIGNIIGGLLIVLLHPKAEERIVKIFLRKRG